jgi:DnaK suppressor protein
MDLTSPQVQELLESLHQLREELQRQLALSRDGIRPVSLDEPIGRLTRMDAIQQQKMTEATRLETQVRSRQVEAALLRHAAGDYGACAQCEEPIGYPRLKVRPEAASCVGCQSRREK